MPIININKPREKDWFNKYKEAEASKARVNYNALTVLLASEALKPYAKGKDIELNEKDLSLCRAALVILKKDKAAFDNVAESVKNKYNMGLGVISSRLTEGQSEEEIESEESIEGYKSGTQSREHAKPENKTIHESFETLLNNTNYAIESLERAVKTGKWSILDAEKAIRCISYVAEPVPRKVAEVLYGSAEENFVSANPDATNRNILVTLSKKMDKLLERDLYVVSRRLVLKYYGSKSLDNLDGILRVNEITNEKKEVSIMTDMEFERDGESGIRYMTPASMIKFVSMFSTKHFKNITDLMMAKGIIASVALNSSDEILLEKALNAFDSSSSRVNHETDTLINAQEALTELFNGMTNRTGGEKIKSDELTSAELRKVLMSRIASVENNTFADTYNYVDNFTLNKVGTSNPEYEYGEGGKPGELDAIREQYLTGYRLNQSLKNSIVSLAFQASMKDADNLARIDKLTPVFPFEVKMPFQLNDLGKKVNLWFESDLTVNRINALPLTYIDGSTIKGAELINKALDEKKLALDQKRNARNQLEEKFAIVKSNELREKLTNVLEGVQMKPTLEGWLKTEELRKLFSGYARKALESIKDITDENILYKTINILDHSANAVIKKDNRKVFVTKDEEGEFEAIAPPDLERVTPSIRFRVLSNLAVTHNIDESVPEGTEAFYISGNSSNTSFYEKIVNECADTMVEKAPATESARKKLSAWTDALSGYNKTMEIINAIRAAGGGNCECCRLMDEAENKAKEIFINNYIDSLEKVRTAIAFLDESEGSDLTEDSTSSSFMQNYMLIGKAFGEKILFKVAEKVIKRAGVTDDLEAIQNLSNAETNRAEIYEKLSPFAKSVLSKVSIAMVTSSLNKIQKDARYYEYQNANDSIWYENDIGEKTGSLFALTKGTIPYVTEESLREEFKSLVADYNTAQKLSVLAVYNNPEKTIKLNKTFNNYVSSIAKEMELTEMNLAHLALQVDVKKSWDDIDKIRETLLGWTGTEDERAEIEELLTALNTDNPLISDKIEDFRLAFIDNTDESILGIKKLVDKTDELRYMTPFSYANRKNKNYSREDFIQKEDNYVKEVHVEGVARQHDLESTKNALTFGQLKELEGLTDAEKNKRQGWMAAENTALVNISLSSIFAPENAFVRELANGVKTVEGKPFKDSEDYEKFGEKVSQLTAEVENGIKMDCYSAVIDAVEKSIINTNAKGVEASPLPKAENVSVIIVPGTGVVSQQSIQGTNAASLNKDEFVNPVSSLDLRDPVFGKTMTTPLRETANDNTLLSKPLSPVMCYASCFTNRDNTFKNSFENRPSRDKDAAKEATGFRKTLLDLRIDAARYENALQSGKNIDSVLEDLRLLGGKTQAFFGSTGVINKNGVSFYDENTIPERPPEMKHTTKRGEIAPVKRIKQLN